MRNVVPKFKCKFCNKELKSIIDVCSCIKKDNIWNNNIPGRGRLNEFDKYLLKFKLKDESKRHQLKIKLDKLLQ